MEGSVGLMENIVEESLRLTAEMVEERVGLIVGDDGRKCGTDGKYYGREFET